MLRAVRGQDRPFRAAAYKARGSFHLPVETPAAAREDLPLGQQVDNVEQTGVEGHVATVVAVLVEERETGSPGVRSSDRVAWPECDGGRAVADELARTLAPASPRPRVRAVHVEDPEFVAARVGDHDPAVREPGRVRDLEQLVGFFTVDGAERKRRLRAELPRQPRFRCGLFILHDGDAGAVLDHHAEPGVGSLGAVLAPDAAKGQYEDRGRETYRGLRVTHSAGSLRFAVLPLPGEARQGSCRGSIAECCGRGKAECGAPRSRGGRKRPQCRRSVTRQSP